MPRHLLSIVVILAISVLPACAAKGPAEHAAENLTSIVVKGCKVELESYCKDVTPGEGRVLACLYAHNDKLSGSCEYALYDAAVQLERAVSALTNVATECADDLDQFCAEVEMGEGRVLECLNKHEMLMDHPYTDGNSIFRRIEVLFLIINKNFPAIGTV